MTIRKNISLSDPKVIEIFEEKVSQNKASSFVQECILFYTQYKPLIEQLTNTPNLLNLIKGGDTNVRDIPVTSEKKRDRIQELLKRK